MTAVEKLRLQEWRPRLEAIAREYPPELVGGQVADVSRQLFHLSLIEPYRSPGSVVCDIGGGVGLFSVGCAAVGWKSVLVDDFRDLVNQKFGEQVLAPHRRRGVEVISRDAPAQGLDFPKESIDVFTSFDAIEHFHQSPKRLLHQMMEMLKPGGLLLIAVPNAVNLRKRITVPLGRGNWSRMDTWYEPDVFRGHVREPTVADLRYVARDLKLQNVRILGRNYAGMESRRAAVRALAHASDHVLRLQPSLCSDLYMLGNQPHF